MSYDLLWLPVWEHGAWMSVGTGLAKDICHAGIIAQFYFRFLVARAFTHEAASLVELIVLVCHASEYRLLDRPLILHLRNFSIPSADLLRSTAPA